MTPQVEYWGLQYDTSGTLWGSQYDTSGTVWGFTLQFCWYFIGALSMKHQLQYRGSHYDTSGRVWGSPYDNSGTVWGLTLCNWDCTLITEMCTRRPLPKAFFIDIKYVGILLQITISGIGLTNTNTKGHTASWVQVWWPF